MRWQVSWLPNHGTELTGRNDHFAQQILPAPTCHIRVQYSHRFRFVSALEPSSMVSVPFDKNLIWENLYNIISTKKVTPWHWTRLEKFAVIQSVQLSLRLHKLITHVPMFL